MRRAHPLLGLGAAFTLLVLLHSLFTPVFEAPDEVWHYAYVRWLSEGHGLPPLNNDRSGAHQEAAQPPLYYAVASLVSRWFSDDDLDEIRRHNPGFGYQGGGTSVDNKNMLIHPPEEWQFRSDTVVTVHATRLTSWLFGLITVIAAWGLGWEVFGKRRAALLTAAFVAFQPQFVLLSSVINNDPAAAALATVGLWSAARTLRRGATWQSAAAGGMIVGLAALTKTSLLLLAPLYGAVLAGVALTQFRSEHGNVDLGRVASHLSLYGTVALLVGGGWYLRNAVQYGDPLGLTDHLQTQWGRPEPVPLWSLLPELPLLLRSFWGAYGWGHITWPGWVYVILWAVYLTLLAPALGYVVRRIPLLRSRPAELIKEHRVLAMSLVALAWSLGILAALLRWMQQVEAPHGRLLFPTLGAWSLLLTLGVERLRQSDIHAGRIAATAALGISVTLATLAPGARILATFMPPKWREVRTVRADCIQAAEITYGDQARLICASATPNRTQPGDTVRIRACWQALRPMERDYTVFVHLLGPESLRVGERHTYPGLGRLPTSLWREARAFCETYAIRVEPWTPAPVRYQVAVGLFDAETGDRLSATNAAGHATEPPIVDVVDVIAVEGKAPRPERTTDVKLTSLQGTPIISLVGYDVPSQTMPGAEVEVTLYWSALDDVSEDYVAFVHLWQPGDAEPVAQHDGPLRDGWFPTLAWQKGDYVPDVRTLAIPESAQPGTYPLWAGLYRPGDGVRLPAYGPTGRYPNDLIPLGEVRIEPAAD
jgi:hypothetical protein